LTQSVSELDDRESDWQIGDPGQKAMDVLGGLQSLHMTSQLNRQDTLGASRAMMTALDRTEKLEGGDDAMQRRSSDDAQDSGRRRRRVMRRAYYGALLSLIGGRMMSSVMTSLPLMSYMSCCPT
jgi:hypothetical protein